MLATLAGRNDEARETFLELVNNGGIPNSTWSQLAPFLAGAQLHFSAEVFGQGIPLDHGAGAQQVHLSAGNQNFWIGQAAIAPTANHSEKQLAWLDQLSAVAKDPAAQAAIQKTLTLILARLGPYTTLAQ
jgi:hypothetical protein